MTGQRPAGFRVPDRPVDLGQMHIPHGDYRVAVAFRWSADQARWTMHLQLERVPSIDEELRTLTTDD